jgi:single-strand DNA-binding protein
MKGMHKMAVTRTRTAEKKPVVNDPPVKPEPVKPEPKKQAERIPGSLAGNLTHDPELRFTASGREVASLNVAVNDRVQNDDGQWEDAEPEFYRVNVWGDQASHAAECLVRGDRIVAVGYFQDREWVDKEGEDRITTEFTAKDIGPSLLFKDVAIKRVQRKTGK